MFLEGLIYLYVVAEEIKDIVEEITYFLIFGARYHFTKLIDVNIIIIIL